MKTIDCYGYPINHPHYQRIKKQAAEVVKVDTVSYIRFSLDDVGPIHRIDESVENTTQILWAYGAWTDKETLEYVTDLNTPLIV